MTLRRSVPLTQRQMDALRTCILRHMGGDVSRGATNGAKLLLIWLLEKSEHLSRSVNVEVLDDVHLCFGAASDCYQGSFDIWKSIEGMIEKDLNMLFALLQTNFSFWTEKDSRGFTLGLTRHAFTAKSVLLDIKEVEANGPLVHIL